MSNHQSISAYVARIIFYNPDNNFYILATTYEDEKLTISGNFISIDENHEYLFDGDFYDHPKYGFQFKAYNATIQLPTSKDLVVSFLSGPNFSGIGEKMALRIYEHFNEEENILDKIIENPENLQGIKGLSAAKIESIIRGIQEHTQENGLFEYLNKYQIDYNDVVGIFNKAKLDINEFISLISNNPFLLMEKQISFKDIDKFASQLQLDDYELLRAQAFVYATLKNVCFKTGSTFVYYENFYDNFTNYTRYDMSAENYHIIIERLVDDGFVVLENEKIYESDQYESESFIAEFVLEFGSKKDKTNIDKYLESYESFHGITFNEEQLQAINLGINCPISIVTGGPGTGKSTIVDALISTIKKLDSRMLIGLCAPTGKASKRLAELTNENSMTIHKMLKFDMHNNSFGHNIFNPLDFDVLIIDEASMIDNLLMANLLRACFNVKKIIVLGDYNQLPSVSQGQVLKDLIETNYLYVTYLEKIYRQKEGSKVIEMAYQVLNKEALSSDFFDQKEVSLIDLNDNKLIQRVLQEYVDTINKNDSQILAPLYKGRLGIDNINKNIQKMIFGEGFKNLNIDDRVIQLKNRNDDEIYNGDVGIISELSNSGVIVDFEHKSIAYTKTQMIELNLAYCISIHKAQGNEYDMVILFLPNYNVNFMDNKILYTAITRTKKRLIIVSDLETLNLAIANTHSNQRKTTLKERIIKEDF